MAPVRHTSRHSCDNKDKLAYNSCGLRPGISLALVYREVAPDEISSPARCRYECPLQWGRELTHRILEVLTPRSLRKRF